MSTTYQPTLPPYESHGSYNYHPSSLGHSLRTKSGMNDPLPASYSRYAPMQHASAQQSQQQQQQQQLAQSSAMLGLHASHPVMPLVQSAAPIEQVPRSTAQNMETQLVQEPVDSSQASETLVYHSLHIPRSISPTGGSLPDFAAQMTCLFWFESVENLKQAQSIRSRPNNAPVARLQSLAKPYDQFRKWTYSVLSTTQVTQNVILLALLFIYRLKRSTPQIKGRAGSEYRLLTVALMLGNKFLDDNTYTNKTWADVSGFNVQEIHVMEVEFLSNMRYTLLASEKEWADWLVNLSCFHEYYERALRQPASPQHSASPSSRLALSPETSPTSTQPSDFGPLPNITTSLSPSSGHANQQAWAAYQQANSVSPLSNKPPVNFPTPRKRGFEEDLSDHPSKRQALLPIVQNLTGPPRSAARPNGVVEGARLPVPQLSVVTNPMTPADQSRYPINNGFVPGPPGPAVQRPSAHVSLPPLQPGMRAMATVFQPTPPPSTMVQQAQPTLPSTNLGATSLASSGYPNPGVMASHPVPMAYATPSKRRSPGHLAAFASSPLTENYGNPQGSHTPMSHTPMNGSPSIFLQQRNSPYKPIRHVNTLLYPPPSASLDQYHMSVPLQPAQMHYQPLGRRNDVRTGVVPEFLVYSRGPQQTLAPQGHYPQ